MSKYIAVAFTLLLPVPVVASVQITEIMYDVSGSDSGREWVEFTNTGSASLDATGFKFFEDNTNHALTLLQGTGVLLPGASALIVEDQAKFLADNPGFGGVLFKASFSLGNTGETLGIKDGSLSLLDSVSYDSSMGASGDGNALVRSGSTFTSVSPTPGTFGNGSNSQGVADSQPAASNLQSSSQGQQTQTQATASGGPSVISATIEANEDSMVGGGEFFVCEAFSATGAALSNPRCLWNFGDGTTAEGLRVFHAYNYPGEYEVVLEVGYNYSSATYRTIVTASPASVSLVAEGDGSVTVSNTSSSELDIGLWSVIQGEHVFVIPEHTIALAQHGVRFAPHILGFSAGTTAVLLYPNSALAAKAVVGNLSPMRGVSVAIPKASGAASATKTTTVKAPLQNVPDAPVEEQSASVAESGAWGVQWTYLLALTAVIATGTLGAYYARIPSTVRSETEALADEFEIE